MLKAGVHTGSLVNHIYSTYKTKLPKVGDGATILHWTDRSACTVIAVEGNIIKVQRDIATRIDKLGMSELQTYKCTPDLNGSITTWKLLKDKKGNEYWNLYEINTNTGRLNKIKGGGGLAIGIRDEYHDYSF